jgi:D-alanine-D-alanine ligase-like ATP-grasp enzyme
LKGYPFLEYELKEAFFRAAKALKLEIFGGDAVVASDGAVYIIDINAWPSFALFRREASAAIARHILTKISHPVS